MRKLALWTVSLLALGVSAPAVAITLEVIASESEIGPGEDVDVDLVISGLGDPGPPSLGVFDLDLKYDPAVLAFQAVVFGDELQVLGLGSIQMVDATTPGSLGLFELSLDPPADLDALQAGSFSLATATFVAAGDGMTPLTLDSVVLGDALGDPLAADLVGADVAVVPEPGAAVLFAIGALVVGRRAAGRRG